MIEATSSVVLAETELRAIPEIEPVPVSNDQVESYVRSYFADTPVMIKVAYCESKFRQYSLQGGALHGEQVYSDIGVMQVNEYYHGAEAKKLGIDIHSLDGNLKFARILYNRSGTVPWASSQYCWGK